MKKISFIAGIFALIFMMTSCHKNGCPGRITSTGFAPLESVC